MKHPDLSPTFVSTSEKIFRSYQSFMAGIKILDIPTNRNSFMDSAIALYNLNFESARIYRKIMNSANKITDAFMQSEYYWDYRKYELLVSKGVIYNYKHHFVDVLVVIKNKDLIYSDLKFIGCKNKETENYKSYYPKIYYRNSLLKTYITKEFVEEHPSIYKKIIDVCKHVDIEIISRKSLKKKLYGK